MARPCRRGGSPRRRRPPARAARRGRAPGTGCGRPRSSALARVRRLLMAASPTSSTRATSAVESPHSVAQGERHPGVELEARVAAGEQQPQQVVLHDRRRGELRVELVGQRDRVALPPWPVGLTSEHVERLASGRDVEPRGRVGRRAGPAPHLDRRHRGVLQGVLGERRGRRGTGRGRPGCGCPPPGPPRRAGRRRHMRPTHMGMTGRTSTAPFHAPGILAATAMASSRSAHSSR